MSQNDYVQRTEGSNRTSLHDLRQAQVTTRATIENTKTRITLTNNGNVPAVMLRLNLKGDDGEQILPVIYSDNYLHLMPGESRTIDVEWKVEDARGCQLMIEITGTNVAKSTIVL